MHRVARAPLDLPVMSHEAAPLVEGDRDQTVHQALRGVGVLRLAPLGGVLRLVAPRLEGEGQRALEEAVGGADLRTARQGGREASNQAARPDKKTK